MSYEEWIECINILRESNNEDIKNKLLNEYNDNLKEMLIPKLIDLVKEKFSIAVSKILDNLDEVFNDNNILDMYLVKFKKDVIFDYKLIDMKEIPDEVKKILKDTLKKDTKEVYDILIKEADKDDPTGVLKITIKNNAIKWGDNNEL